MPQRPRLVALAALALAALAAVSGGATEPLVDARTSWTVGYASLSAGGLSEEDAYLAWSVPLLIRDQLRGISEHAIDAEERVDLARAAIARIRSQLASEVAGLRSQRDAAFLAGSDGGASSAHQRLDEAAARLAALEGADPAEVIVPDRKPLVVKDGAVSGRLFAPPVASEAGLCAAHDLDLLVGGSLREIDGSLLLELWAFHAARDRRVFAYREVTTREQLYDRLRDAGRSLASLLAGRPWAALAVSAEPSNATILVDAKPLPAGRSSWDELDPGAHTLSVAAPGYLPEERTVDLPAATETALSIALQPIDAGTIAVTSDPPGAEAWLDSVWQGITPLELPRPPEASRLVLEAPGRYDVAVTVGPQSAPTLAVALAPDVGSRAERQQAARDRFYRAFGWLLVSLPVPYLCYSWSSDWAAQAIRLWSSYPDEADRAAAAATGFYLGYVGGMVASSSLATWAIVELVRYVTSAARVGD